MDNGIVYLIGAGPGHPELVSVRARNIISRADVVVYDRLMPEALLEEVRSGAEQIYAGKRPGDHSMSQEDINGVLVEKARTGACVARVKGGDPFVFGRGGEEAMALKSADVEFEIVPGVTAGLAVPAWAGIPATHRDVSSAVALITGHMAAEKAESSLDWDALASWCGTLCFYMGVGKLPDISSRLIEHGKDPQTPAAIIERGTTPLQHAEDATLAELPSVAADAGIEPPAIIVVGDVVGLRENIQWYERKALFGQTVVITRPAGQARPTAAAFEERGARSILMPTIRIQQPADAAPLREAIERIRQYDWIIFTSTNGVDYFFHHLEEMGCDVRALAGSRFCAIGSVTGDRLKERGIRADLVPDDYTTEGIVRAFASQVDADGQTMLCPRSDIAPPGLVEGLEGVGAQVDEVDAYSVTRDCEAADDVTDLIEDDAIDWLTFTSTSTVENFFGAIGLDAVQEASLQLASIGPATSEALRSQGLAPTVEADPHTVDALIDAIEDWVVGNSKEWN